MSSKCVVFAVPSVTLNDHSTNRCTVRVCASFSDNYTDISLTTEIAYAINLACCVRIAIRCTI